MAVNDKKNPQGKSKKSKKKTQKPEEMKVEEVKKTEETKTEEPKEKKTEESKETAQTGEIVLKLFMHCEGCARKVKKSLIGFQGVEGVETDCKTGKVIVKGKNADPLKVLERIEKKINKKVELVSPIPKPSEAKTEEGNKAVKGKKADEKKGKKADEKKQNDETKGITVVLKIQMHCVTCSQEIQKRIMKMKGVVAADPDLNKSEVKVKGVFDPPKLLEYIYKKTGKQAVIVKTESSEKKKEEEGGKKKGKEEENAKEEEKKGVEEEEGKKVEFAMKNEVYYYNPPQTEYYYNNNGGGGGGGSAGNYAPQIFSDENPNACSIM